MQIGPLAVDETSGKGNPAGVHAHVAIVESQANQFLPAECLYTRRGDRVVGPDPADYMPANPLVDRRWVEHGLFLPWRNPDQSLICTLYLCNLGVDSAAYQY